MINDTIVENQPLSGKSTFILLVRKLPNVMRDAFLSTLLITMISLIVHSNFSVGSFALAFVLSYGYGFAFAYNDLQDAQLDANDSHRATKNVFAKHHLSRRVLLLLAFFSGAVFIITGAYYASIIGVSLAVLSLSIAWAYSSPPLRFKGRAGLDVFVHSIFVETYPYVLMIILLKVEWVLIDVFILSNLFINSVSNQLAQQIRDYETDKKEGLRTTAVVLGILLSKALFLVANLLLMGVLLLTFVLFLWNVFFITLVIVLETFIALRVINTFKPIRIEWYYKALLVVLLFSEVMIILERLMV